MDLEFGISLDPLAVPQRHTLYDSEEEDEQDERSDATIFSGTNKLETTQQPLKGKSLILALGSSASIFVKSFLRLHKEELFSVRADGERVYRGKCFPRDSGPVNVTRVAAVEGIGREDWVACLHETELRVEMCNLWAEHLLSQGRPSQVLLLLSRHSHELFTTTPSEEEDHTHSMKALHSSTWTHPLIASTLDPPNTVCGEGAAFLTHCEVYSIPAALAILYSTSSCTELEKVTFFSPLLKHPLLQNDLSTKSESEALKEAKQLLPKPRTDLSHLYT